MKIPALNDGEHEEVGYEDADEVDDGYVEADLA